MSKQPIGWKVAVVETDVFGVLAWHARCLEPGCWFEGKRHSNHARAVAAAKAHGAMHAKRAAREFDVGPMDQFANVRRAGRQYRRNRNY